ncbi:hypothetical protein ACMT9U_06535 [Clavibacter sp. Sh2036]|uniref:hypothetical protein n=1 Tax=unclassified Clavibacter TaxID=2626594 RepID=UPI0022EB5015|nr:hypothetical protein [Clavibacter sp. CT19]MDA3803986.1 hypothetical protein [Clavibacter sp. CT19]
MHCIYGTRWSGRKRAPLEALTESEARRRFDGLVPEPDHWFSVGVKRDGASDLAAPEFILEVLPHAEYVKVLFVDQYHTLRFAYGFRDLGGRMFMTNVKENRYPDAERFHPLNESVWSQSIVIEPTGYVKEVAYDLLAKERHLSEYRDVDVSPNWEDVPEFGDWERFGEFDR